MLQQTGNVTWLVPPQGLVCHVGFVADGQQYVIPTAYARISETLYIHGSAVSRMLKTLAVRRRATVRRRAAGQMTAVSVLLRSSYFCHDCIRLRTCFLAIHEQCACCSRLRSHGSDALLPL